VHESFDRGRHGGSHLVSAKHQRRWKVEEEVTSQFPVPTFAVALDNTKNTFFGGGGGGEKRGQGWGNPPEATGHIICINCHLAKKLVNIEIPQTRFHHIYKSFSIIFIHDLL